MSSKIKVDPRTFKIINDQKSDTQSLTSDSESLTSVNSDSTESVKVIKLDSSEQSGGVDVSKPILVSNSKSQSNPVIPILNNNSSLSPSLQTSSIAVSKNSDVEKYLINPQSENITETRSLSETSISESSEDSISTKEKDELPPPKIQEEESPDVIDLTKSQLFDILYNIFTSKKGNTISESIENTNKLFESNNQIMKEILNQLVIMNSNLKKGSASLSSNMNAPTVPESILNNTKAGSNIKDFRETILKST